MDRVIVPLITAEVAEIAEKRMEHNNRSARGPLRFLLLAVGSVASHPSAKNALELGTLFVVVPADEEQLIAYAAQVHDLRPETGVDLHVGSALASLSGRESHRHNAGQARRELSFASVGEDTEILRVIATFHCAADRKTRQPDILQSLRGAVWITGQRGAGLSYRRVREIQVPFP